MLRTLALALAAAAVLLDPPAASAADLLKLTIGQRGNWDTSISHLGEKAGIFKKHGLELEIVYTSGSGETLQPVVAGSVDLGLAVGTLGAISAYAKSAPVRIVGAEATGAADSPRQSERCRTPTAAPSRSRPRAHPPTASSAPSSTSSS
jgi:NitT/TauT family transport system substrate-binding protein